MNAYVDPRYPHIDPKYHSELKPELMAIGMLNPWIRNISASRQQMNASQMGQILVMNGADKKHFFTGAEFEYGRFTHNVQVQDDSRVYDIINKYQGGLNGRQLESPLTTVILVRTNDVVDVAEIPSYYCNHEFFGFEYKRSKIMDNLSAGSAVRGGAILADTPSKDSQGNYGYGKELNMAYTSGQGGIEDGIKICDEVLDGMIVKAYGSRTASWGSETIPLNLFGDDNVFKPFIDIGDYIGKRGLVFGRRYFNIETAPTNLSRKALQQPTNHDRLTYGEAGARVIDIEIVKGKNSKNLAPEWKEQCEFYWTRSLQYYKRIVDADVYFTKHFGRQYKHTPRWNQMVAKAYAFVASDDPRSKIQLTNGRSPVDDWEVKVVYEYDYRPNYGSKLTDHHGGKGVITSIVPRKQMYKDAFGQTADAEMDAGSKVNRMNYGGVYEQLYNASRVMTEHKIREMIGEKPTEEIFDYIMGYYKLLSPNNHLVMSQPHIDKEQHVSHVGRHGLYLNVPTDNPVDYSEVACQIMKTDYAPCRGKCTFEDADGVEHSTTNRILIGAVYMLLLERAGNQFSAVSSPKLNHFAVPAKQSKADRNANHSKLQPTRSGESESRGEDAACGGIFGAEKIDRANNPISHDSEITSIMYAAIPSDIKNAVDRKKIPLTGGSVKEIQEHVLLCSGTIMVDCGKEYEEN